MSHPTAVPVRRLVVVALAFLILLAATTPSLTQSRDFGRTTVTKPDRTAEGDWYGTWIYSSRDERIALYIREVDGLPQISLQRLMLGNAEMFRTDWDGKAVYELGTRNGSFELTIAERDANAIRGNWHWLTASGRRTREELGDFEMYRVEDGRHVALDFPALDRVKTLDEQESRTRETLVLNFRKVSRRIVLWDELPF